MSGLTTISVNQEVSETLHEIKAEEEFNNLNEVIVYLIDGGNPEISFNDKDDRDDVAEFEEKLNRLMDMTKEATNAAQSAEAKIERLQ